MKTSIISALAFLFLLGCSTVKYEGEIGIIKSPILLKTTPYSAQEISAITVKLGSEKLKFKIYGDIEVSETESGLNEKYEFKSIDENGEANDCFTSVDISNTGEIVDVSFGGDFDDDVNGKNLLSALKLFRGSCRMIPGESIFTGAEICEVDFSDILGSFGLDKNKEIVFVEKVIGTSVYAGHKVIVTEYEVKGLSTIAFANGFKIRAKYDGYRLIDQSTTATLSGRGIIKYTLSNQNGAATIFEIDISTAAKLK